MSDPLVPLEIWPCGGASIGQAAHSTLRMLRLHNEGHADKERLKLLKTRFTPPVNIASAAMLNETLNHPLLRGLLGSPSSAPEPFESAAPRSSRIRASRFR